MALLLGAANRIGQDGDDAPPSLDDAETLEVQEKLLPYAVLFGHEQGWSELLERSYRGLGRKPGWIPGGADIIHQEWAAASDAIRTSSRPPAHSGGSGDSTSSHSGGSSGGGFSGGGGGGGFSGGR